MYEELNKNCMKIKDFESFEFSPLTSDFNY
jgi:hypothetical protein